MRVHAFLEQWGLINYQVSNKRNVQTKSPQVNPFYFKLFLSFSWDIFLYLQWGSEIRTSLDFECSKRGWVSNGPDFEWDLISGSPDIWNLYKWLPFCQKPFDILKKMSGFWMVGTIAVAKAQPFEIWPPKSLDFKWSDFRSPLYFKLFSSQTSTFPIIFLDPFWREKVLKLFLVGFLSPFS